MTRLICAAVVVISLGGCIVSRKITSMAAHPTSNNFKVQTLTVRYAVFSVWAESDVWTCQRQDGDKVTCHRPALP